LPQNNLVVCGIALAADAAQHEAAEVLLSRDVHHMCYAKVVVLHA
jgi:hypothetical protein